MNGRANIRWDSLSPLAHLIRHATSVLISATGPVSARKLITANYMLDAGRFGEPSLSAALRDPAKELGFATYQVMGIGSVWAKISR